MVSYGDRCRLRSRAGDLLNEPPGDFRAWVRSTRDVAVAACAASLVGAVIIAGAMQATHRLASADQDQPLAIRLGPWTVTAPDYAISLMVALALLLTIATLTTTLLARLDAHLARRHLRRTQPTPGPQVRNYGTLMVERNLLENWANQLSVVVQVLVLSAALALIGGWPEVVGMTASLVLMAVVSLLFWRRARRVSLQFIDMRTEARRWPSRRSQSMAAEQDLSATLDVVEAMYTRDTQAMRMSPVLAIVLSIGLIVFAVLPLVAGGSGTQLVLVLMILMIWRQRATECVMGVGRLAWQITNWERRRRTSIDADDEDV